MDRFIQFLLIYVFPAIAMAQSPLVLQSDFGVKDAAVASMRGVAVSVSRDIDIHDLTHEIPAYNIWEASLRLAQAAEYWPEGTVFVSVVDPGVGTDRRSVVLQTRSGHFFVSPDNGSLTAVAEQLGIAAVREIDETVNRRAGSGKSYTFHGRDVYAYTGARLAAGVITFEQVGRALPAQVVMIPYEPPEYSAGRVSGTIDILDPQFGNIWTNIPRQLFEQLELHAGDQVNVRIFKGEKLVFRQRMAYFQTFGEVPLGQPLVYLNSVNHVSLAINQGNFSRAHGVLSGPEWKILIEK